LQPCFSNQADTLKVKKEFANAYEASKKVVSLPFHPWLKFSEIDYIIEKIDEIVSNENSSLT